jgi:glyoxylase-like metal-dependent hydrolase (beta-lactamase superfamily II)
VIQIFTFNVFQENTYILYDDTKECIIIDPGCYTQAERDKLSHFIKHKGLKPVRLINTHCHLDHVFGNPFVVETYGLGLEIHPNEVPILQNVAWAGQRFGVPVPKQPEPTAFIQENDMICFGNTCLKTILAPGHSPGSLCFYDEKQGYLIGGDVLFYESIGRTDLPMGNHQDLLQSIQHKLFVLPAETIVYSGHGGKTTIGHEKKYNPFF